jgi:hypothetical protein
MKHALILFGISFLFSSCLESERFPDEPRLTSGRLDIDGSGATMVLGFTDGDGNFGLEEGDTSGLFAPCIRSWNLYAEYYEKQNGQWVREPLDPCDDPSDVAFYYVIPLDRDSFLKDEKNLIKRHVFYSGSNFILL